MNRLEGKTALITGASAGIGKATAIALAREGCRVILTGRRKDRLAETGKEIEKQFARDFFILPMDIRRLSIVKQAIDNLPDSWKEIDILISNAGMARGVNKMQDADPNDWDEMIDTNIKGLLYVTHAVLPGMVERNRGDIVHLGSIAGHEVYPGGNIYCATKHAVNAIEKGLRIDLADTPIRVSSVDPGMVETEFSEVRLGDKEKAKAVYSGMTPLTGKDIAETIVFIVTRPAHVQIAEVVIFPTDQASAMVTHRHS